VEVIRGAAFNVGSDSENYQVCDLAAIVRDTFPRCAIEYAEGAGPDPRSYRVDFGKLARTFPDFESRWTAADGTRELRAAFENVALTLESFQGDKYTRLARLRRLTTEGRLDSELRWLDAAWPTVR
jgi:hypothetical protein